MAGGTPCISAAFPLDQITFRRPQLTNCTTVTPMKNVERLHKACVAPGTIQPCHLQTKTNFASSLCDPASMSVPICETQFDDMPRECVSNWRDSCWVLQLTSDDSPSIFFFFNFLNVKLVQHCAHYLATGKSTVYPVMSPRPWAEGIGAIHAFESHRKFNSANFEQTGFYSRICISEWYKYCWYYWFRLCRKKLYV